MSRSYLALFTTLFSLLFLSGCGDGGGAASESATTTDSEHPGLSVYTNYCAACHNAGVADAPKLGDREQWGYRLKKSKAELLRTTIDGIPPGMPKRGLCLSCSDEELRHAIDYMLDNIPSS